MPSSQRARREREERYSSFVHFFVLSLSFSFFNFITTDTHTHSYIHPISLQDTLVFEGSLPFCNTRAFEVCHHSCLVFRFKRRPPSRWETFIVLSSFDLSFITLSHTSLFLTHSSFSFHFFYFYPTLLHFYLLILQHPTIAHPHTTITTTATITHYCDLEQATQERNASLAL